MSVAARHISPSWRQVAGVAVLALVARLIPAWFLYGTSDVTAWDILGRAFLAGENFYATELHNWPPLWIYFTAAAVAVHDVTGLAFASLVKVPPILADVGIAVLLCFVGSRVGVSARTAVGLGVAYALNPIAVLITGYHGQFDSLMLAPTFLAWYLLSGCQSRRSLVASGLALGVGIWFKPVPLVLLPAILPHIATWRARLFFSVLAVVPTAIGTLPYLVRWPEDVAANFLGYSSWFGMWGYPVAWMLYEHVRYETVPWWLPDPDFVSIPLRYMFLVGRWILLGALAATWLIAYRRGFSMLHTIIATFVVFYFATTGFGLQYLLWVIPFALAARDPFLWPYSLTATFLLMYAYLQGQVYMAPPGLGPPDTDYREFLVKLASLPTWVVCGVWSVWLLTTRRAGEPIAQRSPHVVAEGRGT